MNSISKRQERKGAVLNKRGMTRKQGLIAFDEHIAADTLYGGELLWYATTDVFEDMSEGFWSRISDVSVASDWVREEIMRRGNITFKELEALRKEVKELRREVKRLKKG
jgi:hypothetical protein